LGGREGAARHTAREDTTGDGSFSVIGITPGRSEYRTARELRYRTLYEPWDLPRDLVEDTDGRAYEHFAAITDEGELIGYARLHLEGGESKAYQVTVDESWRHRGVGRALMDAVEARARAEGRDFVELDARVTALGFYERLGYVADGDTFISGRTGTPHRHMRRTL
jgi:ribosomal protein S18 acetylase RimI-like enzyme